MAVIVTESDPIVPKERFASNLHYIVVGRHRTGCETHRFLRQVCECDDKPWTEWRTYHSGSFPPAAKGSLTRVRKDLARRYRDESLYQAKILVADLSLLPEMTDDLDKQFVSTEAVMIAANDKLAVIDKQLRTPVEPKSTKRKRKPKLVEGAA